MNGKKYRIFFEIKDLSTDTEHSKTTDLSAVANVDLKVP